MHAFNCKTGLLGIALLWGTTVFAQDDAIGKFFGKYVDDSRFSVVSVSPKMFRMLSKVSWDSVSPDLKQTVQKLQSFRILSTQSTPQVFYKEAISTLDMNKYEELITVRNKNDNTKFMVKEQEGTVHELLMITVDEGEFTLMSFVGDIDLDKLSKLTSDMSLSGMDGLKGAKIKKNN
jgi:hypothetical protein